MILVAGGTGTFGTRLPRLAGQGLAVRVLPRDPARAPQLAGPGVEVVHGDVATPPASSRRSAAPAQSSRRYRWIGPATPT